MTTKNYAIVNNKNQLLDLDGKFSVEANHDGHYSMRDIKLFSYEAAEFIIKLLREHCGSYTLSVRELVETQITVITLGE